MFFFYEKISISKVLAFLWQFSSIAVSMERSGYLLYELFYAKTPDFSESSDVIEVLAPLTGIA